MINTLKYIDSKIYESDKKISRHIKSNQNDVDAMSQDVLSDLRSFLEHVFFKIYVTDFVYGELEFNHKNLQSAISKIKGISSYRDLKIFHDRLQKSASHIVLDGENSYRIMLEYFDYLVLLKKTVYEKYNMVILDSIYDFPRDKNSTVDTYYSQISSFISSYPIDRNENVGASRYYVRKVKARVYNKIAFYEITLSDAVDHYNKNNRIVFYSKDRIPSNYAIKISYVNEKVSLFDRDFTVRVISNYNISIRPCEIRNFLKIFGVDVNISSKSNDYIVLMNYLTDKKNNLLDIVEFSDDMYAEFKKLFNSSKNKSNILLMLNLSRNIILSNANGANVLRYLLYKMTNLVIRNQLFSSCELLSNLNLSYGCIPFDDMPYASSLVKSNVNIADLFNCIDFSGREYELLAREIKKNSDDSGIICSNIYDLSVSKENVSHYVDIFNSNIYQPKHEKRTIIVDKEKVYIKGYLDTSINIVKKLLEYCDSGYDLYSEMYNLWINNTSYIFSDPKKEEICKNLFISSKIALIYGTAGSGKTETIRIISKIFEGKNIAFIAKTHPAVENLRRRIGENDDGHVFMTIDKYLKINPKTDLLIVDECSTVDNDDMYSILTRHNYDMLLLVGDIYQIESIEFGNWFGVVKNILSNNVIFELDGRFRTNSEELLNFWDLVRNMECGISEYIGDHNFSQDLNDKIFLREYDDEIILCLNYDGPYGINNVNRYFQLFNSNLSVEWGINTYKVGDPVLFNEHSKFSQILFNNLKGKITKIIKNEDKIYFEIEVQIVIDQSDAEYYNLKIIDYDNEKTVIGFYVYNNGDDDAEDLTNTVVPFSIAYATSIHKSQGLEYDSVKIVIDDQSDEQITHNIFYTAITRAKKNLIIYWSPNCQKGVLNNMKLKDYSKDVNIISRYI